MKLGLSITAMTGALAATPALAMGHDLTDCAAIIAGFCIDTTVNLSFLVPLLIFASGYGVNEWLKSREATAARVKLYKALLVEIRLNLEGLKEADDKLPPAAAFSQFLRADKSNRPVLVYHFTADVYQANVANLAGLPSSLIEGVVTFYQTLAFIRCAAASVDLPAFTTISNEGREGLIELIREKIRIAHAQGKGAERQLDQILDGHSKVSEGRRPQIDR
jgi:hypothetical protein